MSSNATSRASASSAVFEELKGVANTSNEALAKLGGKAQWLEPFIVDDKTFCIYIAENEAAVREHARLSGFPASKITEVRSGREPDVGAGLIDHHGGPPVHRPAAPSPRRSLTDDALDRLQTRPLPLDRPGGQRRRTRAVVLRGAVRLDSPDRAGQRRHLHLPAGRQ